MLLKKEKSIVHVNPDYAQRDSNSDIEISLELVCEEAEVDEQWSFVGKKANQRWLWHAVDHSTNTVVAFVLGKRTDEAFKELQALLEP